MRILMIVAIALLIVALICFAVPTSVATDGGFFWLTAGLIAWAVDVLVGGYAVVPTGRIGRRLE